MGLLRRPAVKKEFKLSELLASLRGEFWTDEISIDRRIIETMWCPGKKCRELLAYRGYSNAIEYRAYGICESCDYARLFWQETGEAAAAKKSFMREAA